MSKVPHEVSSEHPEAIHSANNSDSDDGKMADKLEGDGVAVAVLRDEKASDSASVASSQIDPANPTPEQNRKRHVHFITLCACFILEGWHDGSLGPLLPRIQDTFHVDFTIVSLLFVFISIGFIVGAILNIHLTDKLGFGKTIVIGTVLQVIAFTLETASPNFPVWVVAYTVYGFSTALQNAQVNAFVAGLNKPTKMAILHACYGTGALLSPFVATQFSKMDRWSFHYFTLLGLSASVSVALVLAFKFQTQNEILKEAGLPPVPVSSDNKNKYTQIWRLPVVHFLALYLFAYCGIEVTIGSWAVTYIETRDGGGSSSGYISSGFFGGLTVGRLLLLWVNKKLGERLAVYVYAILAVALEIVIWRVPSLIGDAVAISFVGLFLGPMFPIIMNQCGQLIPGHILSGSIGWITSFGLIGTAIVPFMTGALSQRFGVVSLQPLLIGMLAFMLCMWSLAIVKGRAGRASGPSEA